MSDTNHSSDGFIPFPEVYARKTLNAMYRAIPLKDTASRMLRRYFKAMATLYGIIPLSKAYEIIAAQSPTLATEAEFLAFAEIARHERDAFEILGEDELFEDGEPVEMMGRWIIDPILMMEDDMGLFLRTQLMQGSKPYYIPDKSELLRYEDDLYFEQTPQLTAMKAFLVGEMALDEDTANDVVSEMLLSMRYTYRDFNVMEMLGDFGVAFTSEGEIRRFLQLHQELNNHARMQSNRGHTPMELAAGHPAFRSKLPDFSPLPGAAAQTPAKPPKVGRNDPCPCGSGKKYKKCCGK